MSERNDAPALGPDAYVAALAALDVGPARLRRWLDSGADPASVWADVVAGRGDVPADVQRRAACIDVADRWQHLAASGIGVCRRGGPSYPPAFDDDPDPPPVLFHQGDLDALGGPRVAIVGTRRCTRYGRDIAFDFGAALAAAGVSVVSGLAIGIDAAAHQGALDAGGAPPVAVVGSGLDVPYPRANRGLWRDVAAGGVVLTEAALGVAPAAWHFPARNRLIAALADVVVVVESHERGGSLSTVAEAVARDRPVLAVPGPIRSPASAGTNRLLADGCAPACGVDDVLVALGLSPGRRRPARERRARPDATGQALLDALGWQPATLDQLAQRTGVDLAALVVALDRLREAGWVSEHGGWFERIGKERAVAGR